MTEDVTTLEDIYGYPLEEIDNRVVLKPEDLSDICDVSDPLVVEKDGEITTIEVEITSPQDLLVISENLSDAAMRMREEYDDLDGSPKDGPQL